MPTNEDDLASDMWKLANDEELCDVKLEGIDGVRVLASKSILAARSKVFRKMFFGKFAEGQASIVRLQYKSIDLRAIVEFFFTDEIGTLRDLDEEEEARALVRVTAAGHYFEFPKLEREAYKLVVSIMSDHPAIACAVLDEAATAGAMSLELGPVALSIIRKGPEAALVPESDDHGRGIVSVGNDVISGIILDDQMAADEITMFRALKKWADFSEHRNYLKHGNTEFVVSMDLDEDRYTIAKDLAAKLKLSLIPPTDLCGIVSESKFCTSDQLLEAFKAHALSAEKNGSIFSKARSKAPGMVIVQGAGSPVVNGTYIQEGMHNSAPKYVKTAVWKGREEKFVLFQHTNCDNSRYWNISLIPDGGKPGSVTDIDFYSCEALNDIHKIPADTWEEDDEGVRPAPICTFVPGSLTMY